MPRILVVDDEPDLLMLVNRSLTHFGHAVKQATSFDELKPLLSSFKPELIILDVMLSGEDGRDICKKLKGGTYRYIPVMLYSADARLLENYSECHADYILHKPFSIAGLKHVVNSALGLATP